MEKRENTSIPYQVDYSGTVEGLRDAVDRTLESDPSYLSIFTCDQNGFTKQELDALLQAVPVPVCGGIYPLLIVQEQVLKKGSFVVAGHGPCHMMVIPDLNDDTAAFDRQIEQDFPTSMEIKTLFLYIDGLSGRINRLIEALFNVFGLEVNYIGGGAGSLSLEQKPCVFSSQGVMSGGAVIVAAGMKSEVGVGHGFKAISGPFRVTGANGNVIRSLNFEPAFEVYRRVVEAHTRKPIRKSAFYEESVRFPLGINKLGSELLVRDLLKVREDGALHCAGEVFEGEFVDILHGDENDLIQAARTAAEESRAGSAPETSESLVIFMDCISRHAILKDRFAEELHQVSLAGRTVLGACTLGEIANKGNGYLEFYNKTAVLVRLEDI